LSQSKTDIPEGFIAIDEDTEKELRKNIADYKELIIAFKNLKKTNDALIIEHKELLSQFAKCEKDSDKSGIDCNKQIDRLNASLMICESKSEDTHILIDNLRKSVWNYKAEVSRLKNKKSRKHLNADSYPPY